LLDVPCSSEARIRAGEPEAWRHWSLRKIAETSHKHKRLLISRLLALKPGGTLLHGTWASAPEENQGVVDNALRNWATR